MSERRNFKFICGWCDFEFIQSIGSSGDGKKRVSSQVKCPSCNNFLKNDEGVLND